MTDISQSKVAFTLGLLAALLAVAPMLATIDEFGFYVGDTLVRSVWSYYATTAFLVSAVYCYAFRIALNLRSKTISVIADLLFSLSLLVLPTYILLWLASMLLGAIVQLASGAPTASLSFFTDASTIVIGSVFVVFSAFRLLSGFQHREKSEILKKRIRHAEKLIEQAQEESRRNDSGAFLKKAYAAAEATLAIRLAEDGVIVGHRNLSAYLSAANGLHFLTHRERDAIEMLIAVVSKGDENRGHKNVHVKEQDVLNALRSILSRCAIPYDATGFAWFMRHYPALGHIALSGSRDEVQRAIWNLIDAWRHQDGAVAMEVSSELVMFITEQTDEFLHQLLHDEKVVESLSKGVWHWSFTDFANESRKVLEERRSKVIEALRTAVQTTADNRVKKIAERLLVGAEQTDIRLIE